ncbi:RepB family DNA primase [Paenibacillus glycanilyticus]|uniref:DNA-primase RepB domain-containing protein n=1 Tax=Paenibacillus glycanilyticus TaxID=126569 RepID=UPI00203CEED6|nr:DNA-primase RepB domain-containing protein [Paenibacillus glycanilyticus]MCM3629356.1 RepB family DNA primase [Paenibacillus glycanilyticus]
MTQSRAKVSNPVQLYAGHAYRFIEKLGCKPSDQLQFLLIYDAKNNNRGHSFATELPAIALHKPFHSLEKLAPRIKLYTRRNKLVNALWLNKKGYAVFMEINGRETTRATPFKAIRAQFIDVDLNKISALFKTKEQVQQKIDAILSDPSERLQSITITQNKQGQYRLLAQRTKQRIAELKKQFLKKHGHRIKDTMIVETKNGYHIYWIMQGGDISKFVPIQKALAQTFDSDPMITNLSRVMRIPGFYHMKNPGSPYMVKVKQWGREKPFTQEELIALLELKPAVAAKLRGKRRARHAS